MAETARTRLASRVARLLASGRLNSKGTDPYTMWKLSNALAALAASLDAKDATALADDLAWALKNKPEETGPDRKSSLGIALAGVVAPLNDRDKATLAAPGAKVLVDALKNLPETDSNHRRDLGNALAALAAQVHSAPQTQLFGLSN